MGLIAALNFPEGISKSKTAIMKLPLPPLRVLVLQAIPVAPLLLLAEAPKVLAKDPLKNLQKMIKFTEPDTTAMLDKPSGDSLGPRGLLKKQLPQLPTLLLPTPTLVTMVTNLDGPHSVLPVSPPLSGVPVAGGQLKLNLDTVIMDTPSTADIMDTPMD